MVPYAVDQHPPRSVVAAGVSLQQLEDDMESEAATHLREVAAAA